MTRLDRQRIAFFAAKRILHDHYYELPAFWDTFDKQETRRPFPGTENMSAREIGEFAKHVDARGYDAERERMEKSQESC